MYLYYGYFEGVQHFGEADDGLTENSLCHWAVKILCTADPDEKVSIFVCRLWLKFGLY